MKRGILFYLSHLIILTWLFVAGRYLYDNFWPVNIIEHHFTAAKVLNPDKKVKRGDYLEYEYTYSKFRDISAMVSRSFVNDRIVHLTPEVGALQKGLNQYKIHRIYVPHNMFPGNYKLVVHLNYQLNHHRTERVSYETEWFEVVE